MLMHGDLVLALGELLVLARAGGCLVLVGLLVLMLCGLIVLARAGVGLLLVGLGLDLYMTDSTPIVINFLVALRTQTLCTINSLRTVLVCSA